MLSEETRFQGQFIQIAITSQRTLLMLMTYVSIRDAKGYNARDAIN